MAGSVFREKAKDVLRNCGLVHNVLLCTLGHLQMLHILGSLGEDISSFGDLGFFQTFIFFYYSTHMCTYMLKELVVAPAILKLAK